MFPEPGSLGIKICGITQPRQAEEIIALGADALGINFWPGSKRYLPMDQAGWLADLRPQTTLVAVLVNPDDHLLDSLLDLCLVHILQLHGDEPPSLVEKLQNRGVEVIKAFQVRDENSLVAIGGYPCTSILLDAYNPGLYGGSGATFPWSLAARAQELYPERRIILSGGLTPDNVAEAVRQTRPAAVDVASGVESAPGIKDLDRVHHFIENARNA